VGTNKDSRRDWVRPQLKRIDAGSAEARQRDGVPDGSEAPGMARS
jgi:hypothetical protein